MTRPALPRRPLTVGELLDGAVQLVRERALILLPLAAAFAVAEQAALYPVRWLLGVDFLDGFQDSFWQTTGSIWVALALGLGTEAFVITLLGAWTGAAAAADLVDEPVDHTAMLRPRARSLGSVIVAAPFAGVLSALGGLLGPLWVLGYGLFGLAGAVIGLERRGPFGALARSGGLAFRGGMRATWVRVLGYLAWLVLRLGFYVGLLALLDYLPLTRLAAFWAMTAGFVIANAAAYVFLSALDAATLAESRFRHEGLDIWLNRAQRLHRLGREAVAASR